MDFSIYNSVDSERLCAITGGENIGAGIGGCLGGMLLAWAGGPVTGTGYAFICGTAGIATYFFT